MNKMKLAMFNYFPRMLNSLKKYDEDYPFMCVSDGEDNCLLISERKNKGWYNWLPVEKNIQTCFEILEDKYLNGIHQDIKDYYNQYWFYEIYGEIDSEIGRNMLQLEKVVPGSEILDLDKHIERYYRGGDISNFRMIPIGFVLNIFIVIDNITGEVFIDDRIEFGIFRKIAVNLADLINRLEP